MAIGIICRHCGARLKVPEKSAGKLGKCPKCKQVLRVPKAVAPEAHFCDSCGKSLAKEPDIHIVSGKIYCGPCFEKPQAKEKKKKKTGDTVLDEIGIEIPGAVVLRGKDQRHMGRMLQDVAAKKDFKDKVAEPAAPAEPVAPAKETKAEPAAPAKEPKAAPVAPAKEPKAAPVAPAAPAKEPKAEPEVAPAKLAKGQRPSDSKLIQTLVEKGVVLDGELELALQYQKGLGKRLIPVLDDLKLTSEMEIARTISESTGLEMCPEGELEIAAYVESLLDDEIMSHYEVIPLRSENDALVAAFPNPLDVNAIQELRDALDTRVIPKVCMWSQYTEARRFLRAKAKA